ncbi:MAG: DsbA family protein [Bauldia sp.]
MKPAIGAKGLILVVVAVLALAAMPRLLPARIEFREVDEPKGFRQLVLDGESSRLDPLTGTDRGPPASEADEASVCELLFHDPDSPTVGSGADKVAVVAFFDYRCPYCKTLDPLLSGMEADGDIRLVFKEWPILGANSLLAARAALAAARQGKYPEFHARLMASGFIPTAGYIEALAGELSLDTGRLLADMEAQAVTAEIERTFGLAARLGFGGTPSLVVGRTIVNGAIRKADLKRLVADEAASSTTAC